MYMYVQSLRKIIDYCPLTSEEVAVAEVPEAAASVHPKEEEEEAPSPGLRGSPCQPQDVHL